MSETLESRKLCDLKVPELRSELEKRDLDKTGVKAILLERLQKALIEEGEDPENYEFDKVEFKNVNYNEKQSEKNSNSPGVEKKPTTPTKTSTKPTFVGNKKPGPKSKTCFSKDSKVEKVGSNILRKKNDEVKQEQADSSNVFVSLEDTKKLSSDTNNSDVTDSNEAEAKEIDDNEVGSKESVSEILCNENDDVENDQQKAQESETDIVPVNDISSENEKAIKQANRLITFDGDEKVESKEKVVENVNDFDKGKTTINDNTISETNKNEVTLNALDDEDNIQDEELDHEVDEEEIKGSSDDFDQNETDKSNQENNKDDNNEDSINLTIGEDDIKLFADEEDTNIEKEDEVIENRTKEEITLNKQRESRHPVTANSSRATTGSIKSRRSTTEKRISVVDKPRSSHKDDKDNSNAKPIVSVPKDEKKEEEKLIKDKVEAGNKQRFVVLHTVSTTDS